MGQAYLGIKTMSVSRMMQLHKMLAHPSEEISVNAFSNSPLNVGHLN